MFRFDEDLGADAKDLSGFSLNLGPIHFGPPLQAQIPDQNGKNWEPNQHLENGREYLATLSAGCTYNSDYIAAALKTLATAMGQPPRHKQTNFEAFDAVKARYDGSFMDTATKLSTLVSQVTNDLLQLQESWKALNQLQKQFDQLSEDLKIDCRNTMNSVCFSKTENMKILPMKTIAENGLVELKPNMSWFFTSTTKVAASDGFYASPGLPTLDDENALIQMLQKTGFQDLCSVEDPRYRSNEFILAKSPTLADLLWQRISSWLGRPECISTEEGVWLPRKVNEVFKFTKYLSGAPIVPHLPGPWLDSCDGPSFLSVYFFIGDVVPNSLVDPREEVTPVPSFFGDRASPPAKGGLLVVPHGTPIDFYQFGEGIRYIAHSDIIYYKYDPSTQNPYYLVDLPEDQVRRTQFSQMYRNEKNSLVPDSYRAAMQEQVEDLKNTRPYVPNGITKSTFVGDIWRTLLTCIEEGLAVGPCKVAQLTLISKDFYDVITKEEDYWKSHVLRLCHNILDVNLPSYPTWLLKFKALTFSLKPKHVVGTVIDLGSHNIKYLKFHENWPQSNKIEVQTVRSLIEDPPSALFGGLSSFAIGQGSTFSRKIFDVTKQIDDDCRHLAGRSQNLCFLLQPGEVAAPCGSHVPLQDGDTIHIKHCELSVAALCHYSRKSGVVISLGHGTYWIEVVRDYKPIWSSFKRFKDVGYESLEGLFSHPGPSTCSSLTDLPSGGAPTHLLGVKLAPTFDWGTKPETVTKTPKTTIPEVSRLEQHLGPQIEELISDWEKFHHQEVTKISEEFCCIGLPFDDQHITFLSKLLSSKNIDFEIISNVEDRSQGPVLGAFFAQTRNTYVPSGRNRHTDQHLLRETRKPSATTSGLRPRFVDSKDPDDADAEYVRPAFGFGGPYSQGAGVGGPGLGFGAATQDPLPGRGQGRFGGGGYLSTAQPEGQFIGCFRCGEAGHFARECEARAAGGFEGAFGANAPGPADAEYVRPAFGFGGPAQGGGFGQGTPAPQGIFPNGFGGPATTQGFGTPAPQGVFGGGFGAAAGGFGAPVQGGGSGFAGFGAPAAGGFGSGGFAGGFGTPVQGGGSGFADGFGATAPLAFGATSPAQEGGFGQGGFGPAQGGGGFGEAPTQKKQRKTLKRISK